METADALDSLLAIRDGYPTARWNYFVVVGSAASLTYSFYEAPPAEYSVDGFRPFDETALGMRTAATAVLEAIEAVCNLTFSEAAPGSTGQITFGMDAQTGSSGYAYYPYYDFDLHEWWSGSGDIWFNATPEVVPWSAGDFLPGGFGYETLIHEIGHALGLKHPFDGHYVLDTAHDHTGFTVMSYTVQPHSVIVDNLGVDDLGRNNYSYHFQGVRTPMLGDIRALQYLYGANTASHAGDDIYRWANRETFFETIWDGGGADLLDLSNQTLSCNIDLRPGSYSSIGLRQTEAELLADTPELTLADIRQMFPLDPVYNFDVSANLYDGSNNLAIADNVIIEAARGGSGADTIVGNGANNRIEGGGGADNLSGGEGSDLLNGGRGADTMEGGNGNDLFIVDHAGDRIVELPGADTGIDTVVARTSYALPDNIENLLLHASVTLRGPHSGVFHSHHRKGPIDLNIDGAGNAADNLLIGNRAANRLEGGDGADRLMGGAGHDLLNGGRGDDALSGGAGADIFVFDTLDGVDLITDFGSSDRIRLDASAFAGALDGTDHLIYDASTGALYYDADGAGGNAATQFATLTLAGSWGIQDIASLTQTHFVAG